MTNYQNPVYPHDFPDPFVLKYCGEYWAYCTGQWRDGRIFGILRSRDLVNWQVVGGAMEPLPGNHPCYWAPEVTYDNGRFFLYYSVGNEVNMHIRVALALHPAGPFVDKGIRLTKEQFAIDAHVFTAKNGQRYLFYATDFLDYERIGTGTVMDRLLDPFTLAGQPHPVTRARYDWQIYDPQRDEKGGVRWHTIEGSFVLEHKGVYYQMFSGGNWQNPSYGVGYATTDNLNDQAEWQQVCNGEQTLPIVRTIPGKVIGPGHNSVVRGPDNWQQFIVYHRWSSTSPGEANGRQLAIDPLDFAGSRLLVLGPSYTPQSHILTPTFADFFEGDKLDERWQATGRWQLQEGAVVLGESGETAELLYNVQNLPFLSEVTVRTSSAHKGAYGLNLHDGHSNVFQLRLTPGQAYIMVIWQNEKGWQAQPLPVRKDFAFNAYHLLRLEVNGRDLSLCVDGQTPCWQGRVTQIPTRMALFAEHIPAMFAGFSLTVGWADYFVTAASPADLGWADANPAEWRIQEQQLILSNSTGERLIRKGPYLSAYELVVNARLENGRQGSRYGIAPAITKSDDAPLFIIGLEDSGWVAYWHDDAQKIFPLPPHFDPMIYQQFRFRKHNGRLTIHWEQHEIATVPVTTEPTRVGLYGRCAAAFDMVRVTSIS